MSGARANLLLALVGLSLAIGCAKPDDFVSGGTGAVGGGFTPIGGGASNQGGGAGGVAGGTAGAENGGTVASGGDAGSGGNAGSGGTGATGATGGTGGSAAAVWINELHYDNAGTDTGEGVELAGPAGTKLDGWQLVFYNGSPTLLTAYMTKSLSGTLDNQQNGFGTLWVAAAGIQNGGADGSPEPDGIALVDAAGKAVELVSYEGSFTPKSGPATGLKSLDIGKAETTTTPIGQSLGLIGTGKTLASFTWSGPMAASPGMPNVGQAFQ